LAKEIEMAVKNKQSQVLVAHACNPSYPGGRYQEEHSSKSALKKPITQKGLVEWLKV
jgi:hypothetical protein